MYAFLLIKKERTEAMATEASANFLGLPDILPDIYRASSSLDAAKKHIETLEKEIAENPVNMNAMLLKNAFEQYHYCISKLSGKNRKMFNQLHENTVKNHPTLDITTTARKKSVVRFYRKCREKLLTGIPLDDITDIYACRIIIDDASLDPEELIKLCYIILEESITYMVSLGYTPCGSTGAKDTNGFDPKLFPNVIVPKQNYLKPEYQKVVKDYIASPKNFSGYQSLHVVFVHTSGRRFELQIRTTLMDHHAEYGPGSHNLYEENQQLKNYIPPLEIDRSKVHMSSYIYMYGKLTDNACLEKSSSSLLRQHQGAS